MTETTDRSLSQLSVFTPIAYLCVLLSAVRAIVPLAWYPDTFVDEPFFCLSAIRLLEGRTFAYVVHTGAPWSGEAWGYHSPFTFRLFVLPLMLFEQSLFACRLLPCILAHLGILMLVRWMARTMQAPLGAFLFALAWCVGFSFLQTLWARPEGLALFFLTLGFITLHRGLSQDRKSSLFLAGVALGCSVGCSISCVWFCLAAAFLTAVIRLSTRQSSLPHLLALGLGGLLSALLFVAAWLPSLQKCWDQFWWFVGLHKHSWGDIRRAVVHVLAGGFGLRSLWFLGLALCFTALGLYVISHVRKSVQWYRSGGSRNAIPFAMAAAFSLTGSAVYMSSSLQYYYLVYAEVWTQLFLAMMLTVGRVILPRKVRALALLALLLLCIPSAFWSLMRMRESIILPYRQETSKASASVRSMDVSRHWLIEPRLFPLAERAGLSYTPLPWYGTCQSVDIPPDCQLLLGEEWLERLKEQRSQDLLNREAIPIHLFAGNKWLDHRIFVLNPKKNGTGRTTPSTPTK